MIIIGITGTLCSGKGTVTEYLKELGFDAISLSDVLREEAKLRGLTLTRENLQSLGNEIRTKDGTGALALLALEKMKGKEKFVIESIRNPGEVEELKKKKDFYLISLDAPKEIRIDRLLKRNANLRKEDPVTKEEIEMIIAVDEGAGQEITGQRVVDCIKSADFHVFNDKDVGHLKVQIKSILEKIMKRGKRPDWDEYFMAIAFQASKRATCDRKHVGTVIVKDKNILATGYNGSIRGFPHCDDIGHMIEDGHCVATIHAEANAIVQAAKNGVPINGATLYTTASPCWLCFKMMANTGIKRIVYGELYRDERIKEFADKAGIELYPLY